MKIDWKNKKVLILGFSLSGKAAARYLINGKLKIENGKFLSSLRELLNPLRDYSELSSICNA